METDARLAEVVGSHEIHFLGRAGNSLGRQRITNRPFVTPSIPDDQVWGQLLTARQIGELYNPTLWANEFEKWIKLAQWTDKSIFLYERVGPHGAPIYEPRRVFTPDGQIKELSEIPA